MVRETSRGIHKFKTLPVPELSLHTESVSGFKAVSVSQRRLFLVAQHPKFPEDPNLGAEETMSINPLAGLVY